MIRIPLSGNGKDPYVIAMILTPFYFIAMIRAPYVILAMVIRTRHQTLLSPGTKRREV